MDMVIQESSQYRKFESLKSDEFLIVQLLFILLDTFLFKDFLCMEE